MTTISVAMTTFNGERFLREQLDSLASQTRLPDELVVGDDGSTDGTMRILGDFAKVAPFRVIILPMQARLGYRANFMRCAQHCSGDLIAFCDQDDVWLPFKLQQQCEILSEPEVFLSSHAVGLIDEKAQPLKFTFSFFDRAETSSYPALSPFPFALGMTICMKRQCMRWDALWALSLDCNNGRELMAHDQWYPFIASVLGNISFQTTKMSMYRQHQSNVSGNRKATALATMILDKFNPKAAEYRRLSVCAASCENLLSRFIDSLTHPMTTHELYINERLTKHLQNAKDMYGALAMSLQRRTEIALAKSISSKIKATWCAIRAGDYRTDSKWHFRPAGAIRDFLEFRSPS